MSENPPFGALATQCVVKKSDDANPCRFTRVRATHKLVGSAHSLSPRPADGVVAWMHGWRHHPAYACMRVKKNPSDAPVQSNIAFTPARLKLSRPGSTRHLRVAVSGGKPTKTTTFADGPEISAGDTSIIISGADSFVPCIISADTYALQISRADE